MDKNSNMEVILDDNQCSKYIFTKYSFLKKSLIEET